MKIMLLLVYNLYGLMGYFLVLWGSLPLPGNWWCRSRGLVLLCELVQSEGGEVVSFGVSPLKIQRPLPFKPDGPFPLWCQMCHCWWTTCDGNFLGRFSLKRWKQVSFGKSLIFVLSYTSLSHCCLHNKIFSWEALRLRRASYPSKNNIQLQLHRMASILYI